MWLLLYLASGTLVHILQVDIAPIPTLDWTAGVALGLLIAAGRTWWPVVWVGALLVELGTLPTGVSPSALWLAAVVSASGRTVAASVGAWLCTRGPDGAVRLDVAGSIWGFVLGVVPATALMVAASAALELWLFNPAAAIVDLAPLASTWCATSLGTLLGACVVLTLSAKPRDLWRSRLLSVGLPLVAMSLAVLAIFHVMARLDRERVQAEFDRHATLLAGAVRDAFTGSMNPTRTMTDITGATPRLPRAQFEFFAMGQMARMPGLQAFAFVPRVRHGSLQQFEREAGTAMQARYRVTEQRAGELLPVSARSEYFPVKYIYPVPGNRQAIGYDIGSEPARRAALQTARHERRTAVTARVRLVQEPGEQFGVLVVDPIFGTPAAAADDGLIGYSTAVVRIGQLAAAAARHVDDGGLSYRIDDLTAPAGEQFLFGHALSPDTPRSVALSRHSFEFGGRRWQVSVIPLPSYALMHGSHYALYLYSVCAVASLLITGFILLLTGQTHRISGIVEARTRDLVASRADAERASSLLRESVESIDQGFTIFDETGKLVISNRAMGRFYAKSRDLLVPGTTAEDIVRGGIGRGQYRLTDDNIDAWVKWRLAQHRVADGEPFEIQLADGRWLLVVEHKTPSGFTVSNRIDITARRNLEQAQRRSAAFLHAAERVAQIGSFEWCVETTEVRWSEQLYQILGMAPCSDPLPPEEIARRFMPSEERPRFLEDWQHFMSGSGTLEAEYPLVIGEGLLRTSHWIVEWVTGFENGLAVAIGTVHDITDRKLADAEMQRAQQRLAHVGRISTMGEMATGLSHEVNQPLTAIATYAQALIRLMDSPQGADREELREGLTQITTQALRAGDVIRRLRSFVKDHTVHLEPTPLNTLIRELLVLAGPDLRLNDIRLSLSLSTVDVIVNVDAVQIQQVLLNLVRNAIDATLAMEGGERDVEIRTVLVGDQAEVSVIDHASGIDASVAAKLFTQFFTTKQAGTGLGLAISRSIIRAHHGHLDHRATPGGGASFYFTLPVVRRAT